MLILCCVCASVRVCMHVCVHMHLRALLQILTRAFKYGPSEVLLPILDLANHNNSCRHVHGVENCSGKVNHHHEEFDWRRCQELFASRLFCVSSALCIFVCLKQAFARDVYVRLRVPFC